jgi:GNAT superfamily N-acetyltransferase
MSASLVDYRSDWPDPAEYAELFDTTGWNDRYQASAEDLDMALISSWATISAYLGGRLVGFGRAISDGVLYAVLFDVIVHPEYRRRGIGGEIVRRLVEECLAAGIRDLQLFCAAGAMPFYERRGFRVRPLDAPGMRFHRKRDSPEGS